MTFLDFFALIVLVTLGLTALAAVAALGWLPGWLAKQRRHPQADAIAVCGWCGVLTMGVLLPVAYVWAFTKSRGTEAGHTDAATGARP